MKMLVVFTMFVFMTGMLFFVGTSSLSAFTGEAALEEMYQGEEQLEYQGFPEEVIPEEEYEEPGEGEENPGEYTEEPEEGEQVEPGNDYQDDRV
jgi:hypothetical protein